MGRSGYSDDFDGWGLIRWRGAVSSALRGRRGQSFLRELLAVLDAMPEKTLITGELERGGQVCTLGAIGRARGVSMEDIDPYDRASMASLFGIAEALAAEIMYENDEGTWRHDTGEMRWTRMRAWVEAQIRHRPPSPTGGRGRGKNERF